MKKVMVFGTFDLLHPGHLDFFKQAKKFGDKLIVVVGRDTTVLKMKKYKPIGKESARLSAIKSLPIVDQAFLGRVRSRYGLIKKIKPDVICLGYDQRHFTENLKQELAKFKLFPKIIRLKPHHPEKYKSSILRTAVKKNISDENLSPHLN